jgi:hypothetical protein
MPAACQLVLHTVGSALTVLLMAGSLVFYYGKRGFAPQAERLYIQFALLAMALGVIDATVRGI